MKKTSIINKLIFLLLLIFLFVCNGNPKKISVVANDKNVGSSEVVIEVNSNRILHEKDAFSKKFMASTTKILTAITIIDNFDIEKIITVDKKTTGIEGSSIYLEAGERLSIKDLLYGLMLRSGNDCAETLALSCSGSIDKFCELMNYTANKIGAKNSNFVNPHGLHDDNHYTTAYDLALISSYAIKNPIFKDIVSTKKIEIPFTTKNTKRVLINKNKMLSSLDGCSGIKTGYTKNAGRCLVTSCERNGMEVVCVVLNCYDMWNRSTNLINQAFSKYNNTKIIESDEIVGFIDVCDKKRVGYYVKKDIVLPLTDIEKEKIDIKIEIYENINGKPAHSEIGKITIYYEKNLLFCEKIYNIINI